MAYLFSNTEEKSPNIVYMDNNDDWIKKFIRLWKELHIDQKTFRLITTINGKYHQIDVTEEITFNSISVNEFKNYLYK